MFKNMKIWLRFCIEFQLNTCIYGFYNIVSLSQMNASHEKFKRIVEVNSGTYCPCK